ncbi:hypothetical protein B6D60_03815 [candidate division KSB1 bacterium 4484_87]|nr:MAG: hypothetical protein B6D60_03815 [candidate division KSB1 bacterium 4484_87]
MTVREKYQNILTRIAAVRRKSKMVSLVRGALIFSVAILGAFLLSQIAESLFHFSTKGRSILAALISFVGIAGFISFLLKPALDFIAQQKPDDVEIARLIGNHYSEISDKLANALQVFKSQDREKLGLSSELAELSLEKIYEETKEKTFPEAISWRSAILWAKIFSFTVLGFVLLQVLFFSSFSNAAYRLLHPMKQFEDVPKIIFEIEPGNKQVIKNESVPLFARTKGERVDEVVLHLETIHATFHQRYPLTPNAENEFSYTIPHVQDTTIYYFSAERHESPRFQLDVVELPLIRQLKVTITPPAYSGIKAAPLEDNVGDFSCLRGSYVSLKLTANKILSEAAIVLNESKKIPLRCSGVRAQGGFRAQESGVYFIKLNDSQGMENKDPIQYRISIIDDIFPTIAIKFPGKDVDLSEDLLLPLQIEAEDDYGFTALRLAYKILRSDAPYQDTTWKFLPLKYELFQQTKLFSESVWELSPLNLFPGDVVHYFAEVYDNDNVSGPKSTKSMIYSARFPTLEEIYAAANSEQEETYQSAKGLYEKSKQLKKEVDELVQELKKNPEMKWEQKQQVNDVLKNQKDVEKSLEEVQQQLDQMLERMEKNDLVSLETLKKYAELQNLLQEILTDDLKEALKKLQQAAEKMDPELVKDAMEQLNFSQEEFLKNIEKTLELLKRIQIEQKMDELTRKLEQLINDQQKISDQLDKKIDKSEADKISQEQQRTKEKTDSLMKDAQQLADAMKEFPDMPDEAIEALLEQAKREGMLKNMNQVGKELRAGNQKQAQQHSQMAMNSLANMLNNMNQAKQQMIDKQKQEIMRELRRLTHNFVSLSKRQEQLLKKSEKLSPNSPQLNKTANQQQNILNAVSRNADRMAGLSQKSFFVSPQMARAVGQAMQFMSQALFQFEQRNVRQSSRNQQRAMLSLNDVAKQMMSAMKDLANAQSATGLEEMMQKLEQMAGKQQGINQQTLQLGPGQQPFSLSQQAQMARLAAQQQALRKTLEQLQKEFGERSDILGRMDGIGKQMDEVIKDLQARQVSRHTIQRQQKILQRLLDAQKSARRQDFSRKRRAETGKFYPAMNPGRLPENLGERMQAVQKDLLRALKEGYSKDYQQLIKKYFEALIKQNERIENKYPNRN